MHLSTILAAATATSGTENYPYFLGLLAVILSLAAIFQISGLRKELRKSAMHAPSAAPPQAARTSPSPQPASAGDGIAPEIIAVIAAAVATATGKTHRVISVKPMSTSWEKAGRQSVLTSHRIR